MQLQGHTCSLRIGTSPSAKMYKMKPTEVELDPADETVGKL